MVMRCNYRNYGSIDTFRTYVNNLNINNFQMWLNHLASKTINPNSVDIFFDETKSLTLDSIKLFIILTPWSVSVLPNYFRLKQTGFFFYSYICVSLHISVYCISIIYIIFTECIIQLCYPRLGVFFLAIHAFIVTNSSNFVIVLFNL